MTSIFYKYILSPVSLVPFSRLTIYHVPTDANLSLSAKCKISSSSEKKIFFFALFFCAHLFFIAKFQSMVFTYSSSSQIVLLYFIAWLLFFSCIWKITATRWWDVSNFFQVFIHLDSYVTLTLLDPLFLLEIYKTIISFYFFLKLLWPFLKSLFWISSTLLNINKSEY